MTVTDAMVLAYLLLRHPEFSEDVRRAADLDAEWCAPPLWRSELCSVLMKYVRSSDPSIPGSDLTLEGAVERMEEAEALIDGRTFDVASEVVLRLSGDSGLSPYDAEYVVLAQELGVQLLPYDQEVLEAFPETAVRPDASRSGRWSLRRFKNDRFRAALAPRPVASFSRSLAHQKGCFINFNAKGDDL